MDREAIRNEFIQVLDNEDKVNELFERVNSTTDEQYIALRKMVGAPYKEYNSLYGKFYMDNITSKGATITYNGKQYTAKSVYNTFSNDLGYYIVDNKQLMLIINRIGLGFSLGINELKKLIGCLVSKGKIDYYYGQIALEKLGGMVEKLQYIGETSNTIDADKDGTNKVIITYDNIVYTIDKYVQFKLEVDRKVKIIAFNNNIFAIDNNTGGIYRVSLMDCASEDVINRIKVVGLLHLYGEDDSEKPEYPKIYSSGNIILNTDSNKIYISDRWDTWENSKYSSRYKISSSLTVQLKHNVDGIYDKLEDKCYWVTKDNKQLIASDGTVNNIDFMRLETGIHLEHSDRHVESRYSLESITEKDFKEILKNFEIGKDS